MTDETQTAAQTDDDLWAAWDAGHVVALTERDARGPLRLAFYGRCSTEDLQDPETSREWQLRAANGLLDASQPGAVIVAEFFDVGHSRSLPWKRRPEAQRLLSALNDPARGWDALVVGEAQRCWYDAQFNEVAPVLAHYNVALLVPDLGGAYDPANSSHHTLMAVRGSMSRGERQTVQSRVRLGMAAQVAQQGRYQGGRPPHGYRAVGHAPHPNPRKASEGFMLKRLEVDPVSAPVVRRIFDEIVGGKSLRTVAADLNREGILCPSAYDPARNRHRNADGWQQATVRAILENPRYTGYEVWGRAKKVEILLDETDPSWGYKTRFVRNPEPPVRSAKPAHEAIVSVVVWQEAQAVLRGRSAGGLAVMAKQPRNRPTATPRALKGIVHCAHCGRKMWGEGTKRPSRAQPPREDGRPRRGRKATATEDMTVQVRYRCRRRDLVEGSERWEGHPETVTIGQAVLLERVIEWLGTLFDADHRDATIDALTAGLDVTSLVDVRQAQTADRLADAQKRLDRLVGSIEQGVDPVLLAPRMTAVQEEITALRAAGAETTARPTVTRADVAALVAEFADHLDEVFGEGADPAEVNAFMHAIGLRIEVDAVAKVARAEASLVPESTNPPAQSMSQGVLACVRGGT